MLWWGLWIEQSLSPVMSIFIFLQAALRSYWRYIYMHLFAYIYIAMVHTVINYFESNVSKKTTFLLVIHDSPQKS